MAGLESQELGEGEAAKVTQKKTLRQVTRAAEMKEAAFWRRRGFEVDVAWLEARYVGPGKARGVPRDFWGRFDVIGIRNHSFIAVQVSIADLRRSRAKHGLPLLSWVPPRVSVEEWAAKPTPGFFQALASYGEDGVEREWWTARRKGSRKPQLVQSTIEAWGKGLEGVETPSVVPTASPPVAP